MRFFLSGVITLALGIGVGIYLSKWFQPEQPQSPQAGAKPLYWVAPMDPNYRRNQPGKSPMGMDLVPVYETETPNSTAPGVVTISANVQNNLGIRTSQVDQRWLNPALETLGIVQYDEQQLEHIHPRVAGWIETLYVQSSGDRVNKGQPLYALYSPELVYAQEDLLQAVKQNNRRLIDAAIARARALKIPQTTIQNVINKQQVAQTVTFYAPKGGVLANLNVREGFYIEPGLQVMSIATLDTVWVETEVFANQAERIAEGLSVSMTTDYDSEQIWHGQIDYLYPRLDEQNRTLRLRLRLDNKQGHLRPGMFTRITIHLNGTLVTAVEKAAVIRTESENRVVKKLAEGQFQSVKVLLGQADERYIEIVDGLDLDDTVVTSAQFLLDSESSKLADLSRLAPQTTQVLPTATVHGVINQIDIATREITVHRGAIKKWKRPATTMVFKLADHLDIDRLAVNSELHFTFVVHPNHFEITEFHILTEKKVHKND